MSPLINHLWQSTLVVCIAWLGTQLLQRNHARVRYWLWMTASLKFLIPAAVLVSAGQQIEWTSQPTPVHPAVSLVVENVVEPAGPEFTAQSRLTSDGVGWALIVVWLAGSTIVILTWWRHWITIQRARRQAKPVQLSSQYAVGDLSILSSPLVREVGVVGIRRPVLLIPEDLTNRLSPAQFHAVIAHEREHIRAHDNLAALIHGIVEALFWFHPSVWWIEKNLIGERERACDEAVLRAGNAASDYAAGIIEICHYTVRTRLSPVAGINSPNLRQRVESIMRGEVALPLNTIRRLVLGIVCFGIIAVPVVGGAMKTPSHSQQSKADAVSFEVASVRPNKSGSPAMPSGTKGRTYTAINIPLRNVIAAAYRVPAARILNGPEWIGAASVDMRLIGGDRFDINAKLPEGANPDQVPEMLRALLVDRFKLVTHSEDREAPIYALVVARKDGRLGPQLKASIDCEARGAALAAPDRATVVIPNVKPEDQVQCELEVGGEILGRGQRMNSLARVLALFVGRPVLDRTGLTGGFDFTVAFPELNTGPLTGDRAADPVSGIFSALQDQLGLKLESTRGKLDFIVIDRVEHPTDN